MIATLLRASYRFPKLCKQLVFSSILLHGVLSQTQRHYDKCISNAHLNERQQ